MDLLWLGTCGRGLREELVAVESPVRCVVGLQHLGKGQPGWLAAGWRLVAGSLAPRKYAHEPMSNGIENEQGVACHIH